MVDADSGRAVGFVDEALIRHWPTLSNLAERTTDMLRLRAHLETVAESWDERGQPSDALLRGDAIVEAEQIIRALGASPLLERLLYQSKLDARARAEAQAVEVAAWAQQTWMTDLEGAITAVHAGSRTA